MMSIDRREFARALLVAPLVIGGAASDAFAQEVPTTGGSRFGPIRVPRDRSSDEPLRGVTPLSIQVEKAGIDAMIERVGIVDGVMENPTGPWVVSWYEDLSALGEGSNPVMAGHVDYWDIGPAVFWELSQLVPGDAIHVTGEDETVFDYVVDWIRDYVVADLEPGDIDEIVGDTGEEALTLITCAIGTFDPETQEYRERMVLRATQA